MDEAYIILTNHPTLNVTPSTTPHIYDEITAKTVET